MISPISLRQTLHSAGCTTVGRQPKPNRPSRPLQPPPPRTSSRRIDDTPFLSRRPGIRISTCIAPTRFTFPRVRLKSGKYQYEATYLAAYLSKTYHENRGGQRSRVKTVFKYVKYRVANRENSRKRFRRKSQRQSQFLLNTAKTMRSEFWFFHHQYYASHQSLYLPSNTTLRHRRVRKRSKATANRVYRVK